MTRFINAISAGLLLAITGCGGDKEDPVSRDNSTEAVPADASIGNLAASAVDKNEKTAQSDTAKAPVSNEMKSKTPLTEGSPSISKGLLAYVGKYPFDKVDGFIWDKNPAVVAAINKAVLDASIRKTMREATGPAAPIEMKKGKITAWACQVHNCGDHQWAVMIDPKSGAAEVCYFNQETQNGDSRWFLGNGIEEKRSGNCQ